MRRTDAKLFAVAYDIPHDGRRVKVANVLKSYGERVQYSVFECWVSKAELSTLQDRLEGKIERAEDSIRIYALARDVILLGVGEATRNDDLLII